MQISFSKPSVVSCTAFLNKIFFKVSGLSGRSALCTFFQIKLFCNVRFMMTLCWGGPCGRRILRAARCWRTTASALSPRCRSCWQCTRWTPCWDRSSPSRHQTEWMSDVNSIHTLIITLGSQMCGTCLYKPLRLHIASQTLHNSANLYL